MTKQIHKTISSLREQRLILNRPGPNTPHPMNPAEIAAPVNPAEQSGQTNQPRPTEQTDGQPKQTEQPRTIDQKLDDLTKNFSVAKLLMFLKDLFTQKGQQIGGNAAAVREQMSHRFPQRRDLGEIRNPEGYPQPVPAQASVPAMSVGKEVQTQAKRPALNYQGYTFDYNPKYGPTIKLASGEQVSVETALYDLKIPIIPKLGEIASVDEMNFASEAVSGIVAKLLEYKNYIEGKDIDEQFNKTARLHGNTKLRPEYDPEARKARRMDKHPQYPRICSLFNLANSVRGEHKSNRAAFEGMIADGSRDKNGQVLADYLFDRVSNWPAQKAKEWLKARGVQIVMDNNGNAVGGTPEDSAEGRTKLAAARYQLQFTSRGQSAPKLDPGRTPTLAEQRRAAYDARIAQRQPPQIG